MKYIRTKDGIFEGYKYVIKKVLKDDVIIQKAEIIMDDVIKTANTIEELIMPCDLVQCGLDMYLLEKDRGICLRAENMHLVERKKVDRLWIAVGEDIETYPNFKLVAEKDKETGRLELL